jgi:hypothetical protein
MFPNKFAIFASVLGVIRPSNINGNLEDYRCIFKFNKDRDSGNVYPTFKVSIFSSWGDNVCDEVVIGSNGTSWWGNVTHLQTTSLIKYYAVIIDSYVYFYAQPVGASNYHLVVGQVYILGLHSFQMVNQNVSDLPSGATEITAIS